MSNSRHVPLNLISEITNKVNQKLYINTYQIVENLLRSVEIRKENGLSL